MEYIHPLPILSSKPIGFGDTTLEVGSVVTINSPHFIDRLALGVVSQILPRRVRVISGTPGTKDWGKYTTDLFPGSIINVTNSIDPALRSVWTAAAAPFLNFAEPSGTTGSKRYIVRTVNLPNADNAYIGVFEMYGSTAADLADLIAHLQNACMLKLGNVNMIYKPRGPVTTRWGSPVHHYGDHWTAQGDTQSQIMFSKGKLREAELDNHINTLMTIPEFNSVAHQSFAFIK